MPLNSEASSPHSRHEFCLALKAARECNGISRVLGNDGGATPEPAAAPEVRAWVSDARRVGPATPSRLRVRIKFSQ